MEEETKRRRIVSLERVSNKKPTRCVYCYSPVSLRVEEAVAAVEVELEPPDENVFFGICGNHAELSHLTTEWQRCETL